MKRRPKKRFSPEMEHFFSNSGEDQKKKKGVHHKWNTFIPRIQVQTCAQMHTRAVADPENFGGGGMIKILSTKPEKFGCVVIRCVARNSQWSDCFRGLAPSAQKFCFFFAKII